MKLGEIASLVRSKNAGPFVLTIDIMFEVLEHYEAAKRCPELKPQTFADLYGIPVDSVDLYHNDASLAIKVSFPRPWVSGSRDDRDVYGGQMHGPIVEMELSVPD